MRILAIGNSFSQDATYYLHQTAKASGIDLTVVNLYIGGCSLERHWQNAESDESAYLYEENGESNERYVSLSEALREGPWDCITLQQSSYDSGWVDSYELFFGLLLAYVKRFAPQAKLYIHQTWAYDTGSGHGCFMRYHRDQEEMHRRLASAYGQMAEKYALPVIPVGDVIRALRKTPPFSPCVGEKSISRDGFHLHYLYGRYAAALTWLKILCGINATENDYVPETPLTDEKAEEALLNVVRSTVETI